MNMLTMSVDEEIVQANVNDIDITFMLDSGAHICVVPEMTLSTPRKL